jgi:hypothetical protein
MSTAAIIISNFKTTHPGIKMLVEEFEGAMKQWPFPLIRDRA